MTIRTINEHELSNDLPSIIRELANGTTFVLISGGLPVAEIAPIRPKRFVAKEMLAATAALLPPIDVAKFMDDVDNSVDQTVRDPYTDEPLC